MTGTGVLILVIGLAIVAVGHQYGARILHFVCWQFVKRAPADRMYPERKL